MVLLGPDMIVEGGVEYNQYQIVAEVNLIEYDLLIRF